MKDHTASGPSPRCSGRQTPPDELFAALSVLSGKWRVLILWQLFHGTWRFNALLRSMPGITQHMLTRDLRELEAAGVVTRTVFAEVPPRVEYELTELGRSLGPVFQALADWGTLRLKGKSDG